jgi:LPS sulfotransferase NodH
MSIIGAVGRLYEKAYDFPLTVGEPALTYMVASIPRTGSTHFCLGLWRTGCLGAPMEYINIQHRNRIFKRLSGGDPAAYWPALTAARTSPNGVFGFKAFIPDFQNIADKYEALLPAIRPSKVIYFRRRDRVSQVLSYARAVQTNAWFHDDEAKAEPRYDSSLFKAAERWINSQESWWRSFFETKKIEPLPVFHEDFLEHPTETLRLVTDFLGIELDQSKELLIPEPRKQSDELTEAWRLRYMAERRIARAAGRAGPAGSQLARVKALAAAGQGMTATSSPLVPKLYRPEFDFPRYEGRPKVSYMIAATPRSGSTHFALSLWRTGLLGSPLEYTNFLLADQIYARLGAGASPADYWRGLEACRTSPNGVFGFKTFFHDFEAVAEKYEAMLPLIAPSHIIYLNRRDQLAQTVSYARAAQTQSWFADAPTGAQPQYDSDLMVTARNWIESQQASWERLFKVKKVEPLRLFHEDFIEDPDKVLRQVSDHLGVQLDPAAAIDIPMIEKQADEISRDWKERLATDRSVPAQ